MPSLGCKTLCIVIYFLALWSVCSGSSLAHFNYRPNYLTKEAAEVFIPLMSFLLQSLVLRSFLVCLKYSFLFLPSSPLLWLCSLPNIPKYLLFLFSTSVLILSGIDCSIPLFIISMPHFYAKFHSYILAVYSYSLHQSFFNFFANSMMSSILCFVFVNLVGSILLKIVRTIAHLPGRCLSGFSLQLNFFL